MRQCLNANSLPKKGQQDMNQQTAEELGRKARIADQLASPLCSPEMFKELEGARVGEKTHLMEAFSRGWHNEHHRLTDEQLRATDFGHE